MAIELTQLQLGIIVAIMWVGVIFLILGLYWINRKYPKRKEKLDPIYKGVILVLVIFLVHVTAVAIGVLEQDSIKENLHWYGIAIVVAIAFYAIVSYFSNRIIPSYKLWKYYVMPEINRFWNAKPYVGKGYSMAMSFYQVIEGNAQAKILRTQGLSDQIDKVQVFMGKVHFANVFEYLAIANKKTGEILRLQANPPLSQKQELTTRDFMSSYQYNFEDYGTQQEPEKEIEVRNG